MPCSRAGFAVCIGLVLVSVTWLEAQEPLHQRIDSLVRETSFGVTAPLASDAEFVRRVHLDLIGRTPSAQETRAFLDNPAADKRAALIDRLLASPQFNRHWANVLDVMLMERRADQHVKSPEWQAYLFASVQQNKPFDQLAREILAADPAADDKLRPAAKFYLDRQGEVNTITRDLGRVFFGVDLQCSQCHDHPLINDYFQSDYYGLFAFVARSSLFTDKAKKVSFAEKADGEAKYASVFTKKAGQAGPTLPGGRPISEPTFNKGEEYSVAPADGVLPVPKFSRRAQLAATATNGSNVAFNRNIANRWWAHMLGRGLVEPVDLHHSENPPTHPKLLDLLAAELVALKFDARAFLRQIALTQVYQRAIELPPSTPPADLPQQLAGLEAEAQRWNMAMAESAKQLTDATTAFETAEKAAAPALDELNKANAALATAQTAAFTAAKALDDARKVLATKQDIGGVLTAAAMKTQEAVKKLPDDKELAAAAEKFVAKAAQLTNEIVAANKKVEDLTPNAKTTADATAAAQQAVAAVLEKTAASRQQLDGLKQNVIAITEKLRSERLQARHFESRIADAKSLAGLSSLDEALAPVRAAADKAQADLVAAQQSLAPMQAELAKRQAELTESQKLREAAVKSHAESAQQLAARQEAAKSLTEAAVQAEAAKQKLPNDAEVVQAAATVKAKSDKAAADVAESQKLLAEREQVVKSTTDRAAAVQQMVSAITTQLAATQQQIATLDGQVKQAREQLASAVANQGRSRQEFLDRWSNRFLLAGLRPLTSEQLAWSIMQATGVVDIHTGISTNELNQKMPLDAAAMNDPAKLAERAAALEATVHGKLAGSVGQFVQLFSNGGGQPQSVFFATVDQALFVANGATVRSWLAPAGGNLADRLAKLEDPKALSDELYLSILSRRATETEIAEVTQYLASRPNEKPAAVQELAWGLLSSAEFRFNH